MKTKKMNVIVASDCHEVQIHYRRPIYNTLKKTSSSKETDAILRDFIDLERLDLKEFFWVILLTNANHVLGISEIGVGCTGGVMVNSKEICQLAILCNASAVIVAHNHPSGKLEASSQDRKITQKLKKILDIINITLLDHLIITSESFLSFQDEGWM